MVLVSQSRYVAAMAVLASLLTLAVSGSPGPAEEVAAKSRSRFLKELKKREYTETKAPAEAPVFRWDFSGKVVHTYAFAQESRLRFDTGPLPEGPARMVDAEPAVSRGPDEPGEGMSATTKGVLLVKSQGDGTANLVLTDMKVSMKAHLVADEEPETMEQSMPPVVVQGMKEDGSASFGNSSQDMLLRTLFPLPDKPLDVGETVDVPASIPFNAMGSPLPVKGRIRITLTRYVKIEQRTCAQLDVDIDISDIKVPPELKGEYECAITGTSVFYFDVAERVFASGESAMLMRFRADAPMPEVQGSGQDAVDMPVREQMSMTTDNLIRITQREGAPASEPGAPADAR